MVQVRHITLGRGVVAGSILFTPNAVIFDPDSQAGVADFGSEYFLLMDFLMRYLKMRK